MCPAGVLEDLLVPSCSPGVGNETYVDELAGFSIRAGLLDVGSVFSSGPSVIESLRILALCASAGSCANALRKCQKIGSILILEGDVIPLCCFLCVSDQKPRH